MFKNMESNPLSNTQENINFAVYFVKYDSQETGNSNIIKEQMSGIVLQYNVPAELCGCWQ